MLYSYTHMTPVGVKGLGRVCTLLFVVFVLLMYAHTTNLCAIADLKFRIKHKNKLNSS